MSDDTELKAGAAAAFVLGAWLERLDLPPAQATRDFDLVFSDGSREPLEITSYVDRPRLAGPRSAERGELTLDRALCVGARDRLRFRFGQPEPPGEY
jgi:hypothetical protein